MCWIQADEEEGSISEQELEDIENDESLYLDKFPDPFENPISKVN